MVRHHCGGILTLLSILKDHWGAVERDLQASGYTFDDVCSDRLPLSGFTSFVVYAPPGTAVFHKVNAGWTSDTHQLATLIDVGQLLLWAKTEDAQRNINRPDLVPRPGLEPVDPGPPSMTIGDYMKLAGLEGGD